MIQFEQIGEIKKYRLARSILGRGLYFTACYWIDGLVVDTGCTHTLDELVSALDGLPINGIVNTHGHEDHIAANAALQAKYGVKALAHPLTLPRPIGSQGKTTSSTIPANNVGLPCTVNGISSGK